MYNPDNKGDVLTIFIHDKKDGQILTEDGLALRLYREGVHIVYCDIEGISKMLEDGDYYLHDECGNSVWLDPERFEVRVS